MAYGCDNRLRYMVGTMTTDATALVTEFCAAFGNGKTPAELVDYFTDDAVYHNIPVDPAVGHDAILALLNMFMAAIDRLEFQVRNIAAVGDTVLTERIDVFHMPNGKIELPVMGTFEVKDGKIVAWRDYFDLNQYMTQLQGAS
jgi:limonene-1,2-epoxide hydrolase